MLIGGNSSTSGFTQRCQQTAAVFGPEVMLWLASAGPQDAVAYPTCVHIVRLPNWIPSTTPNNYCREVRRQVDEWRAYIPDAIFALGNEPDLESGHFGQRTGEYARAMKNFFPGIRVGNPALSVQASASVNADACDVVLMHSYFERQHPDTMDWMQFGASYRFGLEIANGRPVYVTECNAVQTGMGDWESGVPEVEARAWSDRNEKLAAWLDQAERDGIEGACIFIFDAADDWASFDVGPEAAAQVVALRSESGPSPITPPPPSSHLFYESSMNPLTSAPAVDDWIAAIRPHNARDAEEIVAAYRRYAPVIRYDANLAIAQAVIETGWFTEDRWTEARNPAGIGIYGDDVAGYHFGTIERGVQSHLALLNCYYGNGVDPWGPLTEAGYGGFVKGFVRLDQMNGVWAVPGTYYAQTIVEITIEQTGQRIPDAIAIIEPEPITTAWAFVQPCTAPIFQGSWGSYSHAGNSPGFFAIDYAPLPMFSPIYAVADGEVIYNGFNHPQEGQTGHTICVRHDGGYESRYCHLDEYWPNVGAVVVQGEAIGKSGAPDYPYPGANGYGSGPHLHFSLLQWGHWVPVEDLMAQGMMAPIGVVSGGMVEEKEPIDMLIETSFDDGELQRLWDGPKTVKQKAKAPFVKEFSIPQAWVAQLEAGLPLGFAVSGEEDDPASGRRVQFFSNGKITYFPADGSVKIN